MGVEHYRRLCSNNRWMGKEVGEEIIRNGASVILAEAPCLSLSIKKALHSLRSFRASPSGSDRDDPFGIFPLVTDNPNQT